MKGVKMLENDLDPKDKEILGIFNNLPHKDYSLPELQKLLFHAHSATETFKQADELRKRLDKLADKGLIREISKWQIAQR